MLGDAAMNLVDGASRETFVESHVIHGNLDSDKETDYARQRAHDMQDGVDVAGLRCRDAVWGCMARVRDADAASWKGPGCWMPKVGVET